MKKSTLSGSALALVAMLALAGCSGGSDDTGTSNPGSGSGQAQVSNEVPESAGASSSAFIAFLKTMMSNDETSEPMKMREGWAVPADDTGEPASMS